MWTNGNGNRRERGWKREEPHASMDGDDQSGPILITMIVGLVRGFSALDQEYYNDMSFCF